MTRNLRTQVVDLAEHALRSWHGDDMTREQAAELLPSWRFAAGLDEELRREVLGRFSPAEPPSVPGKDWLPTFCTNVYVGNEGEFKCDRPAGHGDHHWHLLAEFGWPVEVTPDAEPLSGEVTSPFGPCNGLTPDRRDNTCTNTAAEYVAYPAGHKPSTGDGEVIQGTNYRRLCTTCADAAPGRIWRRALTTDAKGYPVERAS